MQLHFFFLKATIFFAPTTTTISGQNVLWRLPILSRHYSPSSQRFSSKSLSLISLSIPTPAPWFSSPSSTLRCSFSICLSIRSSSILRTWPYHFSWFICMSTVIVCLTPIIFLILSFPIWIFQQLVSKSPSLSFRVFFFFSVNGHTSLLYVTTHFTMLL